MRPADDLTAISMAAVTFRRDGRTILGPIDWSVERGQRWVVMGPNGSAKTTLVRLAAVMEHPSGGILDVLGERLGRTDVRSLRGRIGFVCPALISGVRPTLTALEFVMTARRGALEVWWHSYTDADRQAARLALDAAGIGGVAHAPLSTLSSGESQRAQLARALVAAPELLILDEPAAGLDIGGREDLIELIDRRLAPSTPLVLVTHHPEEIPTSVSHALVLRNGTCLAQGPIETTLTSEVLSEAFGVGIEVRRHRGRWAARC